MSGGAAGLLLPSQSIEVLLEQWHEDVVSMQDLYQILSGADQSRRLGVIVRLNPKTQFKWDEKGRCMVRGSYYDRPGYIFLEGEQTVVPKDTNVLYHFEFILLLNGESATSGSSRSSSKICKDAQGNTVVHVLYACKEYEEDPRYGNYCYVYPLHQDRVPSDQSVRAQFMATMNSLFMHHGKFMYTGDLPATLEDARNVVTGMSPEEFTCDAFQAFEDFCGRVRQASEARKPGSMVVKFLGKEMTVNEDVTTLYGYKILVCKLRSQKEMDEQACSESLPEDWHNCVLKFFWHPGIDCAKVLGERCEFAGALCYSVAAAFYDGSDRREDYRDFPLVDDSSDYESSSGSSPVRENCSMSAEAAQEQEQDDGVGSSGENPIVLD